MSHTRSRILRFALCLLLVCNLNLCTGFQPKTAKQTNKTEMKSSPTDQQPKEYKVKTWNPLRLLVLRLGLTEPAWTSPLNYQKKNGTYNCAYCGQELFDASMKYDSGSGWPSFWRTIDDESVSYKMEFDGRMEIRCGRCTSHLGHVFMDGPKPTSVPSELLESSPPSDPRSSREGSRLPRYCVNGASLRVKESSTESD